MACQTCLRGDSDDTLTTQNDLRRPNQWTCGSLLLWEAIRWILPHLLYCTCCRFAYRPRIRNRIVFAVLGLRLASGVIALTYDDSLANGNLRYIISYGLSDLDGSIWFFRCAKVTGSFKVRTINTNFADVSPIRAFVVSVLVILSPVLDDLVKPLHPVLVDRYEFILRGGTENFRDRRKWLILVRHGN